MKLLSSFALTATIALTSCIASSPVHAQGNCVPHEVAVERLFAKYGETLQTIAISSEGTIVETFASNESGSWTITVTTPDGVTCLVASGQAFEVVPQGENL